MTDASLNRVRVANGGMAARVAVAVGDGLAAWALAGGLVLVAVELAAAVGRATDRAVGLSAGAERLLLVSSVCVVALIHARWTAGRGGPLRRATDLRVVDASSYASIGYVQALYRVAVRELVFVTVVLASAGPVLDRLPAPGDRPTEFVLVWLVVCRLAPPALAWFLPRGRGIHDLAANTLVIHTGVRSRPPVVEPRLVSQRPAILQSA